MTADAPRICDVCGRAAGIIVTEIRNSVATTRSLCDDHAPSELPDDRPKLADDVWLDEHLKALTELAAEPLRRAERRAELDRILAWFERDLRRRGMAD